MILTKEVETQLCSINIKYYENMGYEIPRYYDEKQKKFLVKRGTRIKVRVEDLTKTSRESLDVKCDYCGEIYQSSNSNMNTSKSYGIINKHACNKKECRIQKTIESNMEIFGVENIMHIQENVDKIRSTNLERYGVEWYSSTEECKDKVKNTVFENFGEVGMSDKSIIDKRKATIFEKYGVTHHFLIKEITYKSLTSVAIGKYENNSAPVSTQQLYINDILNGVMNYPIDKYNLDISFPEDMLYLECDFSGHDMAVKFGNCTQEYFNQKENIRYFTLKNLGWKCIKLYSPNDKIPINTSKILEAFEFSKSLLKENNWVRIIIDDNIIETKFKKYDFDFGNTKRMNKSNFNTFEKIIANA